MCNCLQVNKKPPSPPKGELKSMKLKYINMTKSNKTALIIIIIVILFFGFKIFRFIQIDNCLDKSGSWNYEKCECENN